MSKDCEYGTHLDEALRDRLVSGLAVESIQRKLLAEKELTFAQACEIALAMEMALKNSSEILGKAQNTSVNQVSTSCLGQKGQCQPSHGNEWQKNNHKMDNEQRCYLCGGGVHSPQDFKKSRTLQNRAHLQGMSQ